MANVNWISELLKCFSINDKCCWLFCLLWHHKTFQEAASFVQGKREEVAASDDVHSDLLMLWGQAWLQMTLPFLLQSSITSIKHATLLSLKRRACANALSPPPSFSSHQALMTHNLSLKFRFSHELQTYKHNYYWSAPPNFPGDLKLVFTHWTHIYQVVPICPQCHFVGTRGTIMNKVDTVLCGT